jgi:hypothetical protein
MKKWVDMLCNIIVDIDLMLLERLNPKFKFRYAYQGFHD